MNKRKKRILLTVLLGIVLLLVSGVFFLHSKSKHPKLPKEMDITISKDCKILEGYNDHDHFLGDGVRYLVLQYPDEDAKNAIEKAEHWHKLPLSKNLETFLTQNRSLFKSIHTDTEFSFPENGYFFFMDRFIEDYADTEKRNPISFEDTKLLERHAYNFTIAIFDAEKTSYIFMK